MIMGGGQQGEHTVDYNCLLLTKRHYMSPFI
jgi:hypothetical protein